MLITFILRPENLVLTQVGVELMTMLISTPGIETRPNLMYHVTH